MIKTKVSVLLIALTTVMTNPELHEFKVTNSEKEEKENVEIVQDVGVSEEEQNRYYTMRATHYTSKCNGCSGITAFGLDVRNTIYHNGMRIIATDKYMFELGTIVQVTYENGETFKAIVGDRGGAIKGNKIDILVSTKEEMRQRGVKNVKLEVLE